MTNTYRGGAELSRRTTNMPSPDSVETDETVSSDYEYDEKYHHEDRRLLASPPFGAAPKKPLITYVTNEWQTNPRYKDGHDLHLPARARSGPESQLDDVLDYIDDLVEALIVSVKSPRFRRSTFFIVTAIMCSLWIWFSVIRPHIRETQAALATFEDVKPATGLYGHNQRPSFSDMIQLKTLDPELLPDEGKLRLPTSRRRRLVFVGDIHGCKDELVTLLEKAKFNPQYDHLITTGDMIDKGPDSLGVLDLLHGMNASCVRGNHEDRVLLTRSSLQHMLVAPTGIEDQSKSAREDDGERALARSLSKEQAAYLQSCPVILRIGDMSSLSGEVVVVHAGLVPGVPLENQDPISAMTMRIIDLATHMPSAEHDRKNSVPWARLWNKVQTLIPREHTRFGKAPPEQAKRKKRIPHLTIIYGHDSKRGLQLEKWTKGLDSGCVKGGKLSALVLDGGRQNLVQVNCRDYRKSNGPDEDYWKETRKSTPGRNEKVYR
jgi:hypothetical protein